MLKLLIVEDEDIIRKGIIFTTDWASLGYVIEGEAASGEEGYEKILNLRPDVVLTDIKMPGINGIEMIERARQIVEFEAILLTSYAEFGYAKKAIHLEVKNYLLKPVVDEELMSTMQEVRDSIMKKQQIADVLHAANQKSQEREIDLGYFMMLDKKDNQYVTKTLEIIHTNYQERLLIGEIAEELGISVSYLSREFKKVTGMTFLDALNRYRINMAIEMLNEGTYRMGEIADRIGFADYKYFCEVFKKYTNVSPRKFAKGNCYINPK